MSTANRKQSFLNGDFLWSIVGLGALGLSGIALNVLIASYYPPETLGVFNQIGALYVVLCQLATLGLHLSVQKQLVHETHDRVCAAHCLSGGLWAGVVIALPSAALFFAFSWVYGAALGSNAVIAAMPYAALGFGCAIIGKILLSALNALSMFRSFAMLQAARVVFSVVALCGLIAFQRPAEEVMLAVSIAEATVLLLLLLRVRQYLRFPINEVRVWVKRHVQFGVRSVVPNTLLELNARVDVMVLGIFASDTVVGVYSFAAMVIEGVAQLPIIVRTLLHPHIVAEIHAKHHDVLTGYIRRARLQTYQGMALACALAVPAYVLLLKVFAGDGNYDASIIYFIILVSGVWAASGYAPFATLPLQAGLHRLYFFQIVTIVAVNVLLNFMLVPFYGALGAALATAFANAASVVAIRHYSRYKALSLAI